MLRFGIHYGCHFIVPLVIALLFFPKQWVRIYLIGLAVMCIDLDHLLADPIFDPNRCSVGFHVLHNTYAIIGYCILSIFPKTRYIGIALLWHICTDLIDCWLHTVM